MRKVYGLFGNETPVAMFTLFVKMELAPELEVQDPRAHELPGAAKALLPAISTKLSRTIEAPKRCVVLIKISELTFAPDAVTKVLFMISELWIVQLPF